eukprot:251549_1
MLMMYCVPLCVSQAYDYDLQWAKVDMENRSKLNEMLRANNLYDGLHRILHDHGIGLDKLQNEFQENDTNITKFCDALSLNIKQKLKFRKLIRIINAQQTKRKATTDLRAMQISVIGDSGVGKTSLIHRYIYNKLHENNASLRIGDCMEKQEYLSDDCMMALKIWDIAGEAAAAAHYQNRDCIILCYDTNNEQSFANCNAWREQIKTYAKDDVIVFVVGCKSDLVQKNRAEFEEKECGIIHQTEWKQWNTLYGECSAKRNHNVRNIFTTIAELENKKQKRKLTDKKNNKKTRNRNDAMFRTMTNQIRTVSCKYGKMWSSSW